MVDLQPQLDRSHPSSPTPPSGSSGSNMPPSGRQEIRLSPPVASSTTKGQTVYPMACGTEQGSSRTNRDACGPRRSRRRCLGSRVPSAQIRGKRAVEARNLLSPTRRGTATSFTGCCGGPGTLWPCQARGCGRNIENFRDGQRLPKMRAGCSSHPGGTTLTPTCARSVQGLAGSFCNKNYYLQE